MRAYIFGLPEGVASHLVTVLDEGSRLSLGFFLEELVELQFERFLCVA